MICSRCLLPDTKPDLHFDEDGVCSACRAYDARKDVDWEEREQMFTELLDRYSGVTTKPLTPTSVTSTFDCIIPSSGGKDSTYQTLKVIEHGYRPLVVTASTCHLTPIGRANIDNLKRYATTIEVSPNIEVRKKLNKIGLTMVGDISLPEHWAIFCTPFKIADAMGIPLILYGENPQNQYGGPPDAQEAYEMTQRWVQEFGGFCGLRPSDVVGMEGITEADMADYQLSGTEGQSATAHFMGHYFPWDSRENARVSKEAGMLWQIPHDGAWWPFENLDNFGTGLHDFMMWKKFEYSRSDAQLSVDIRSGFISRNAALDKQKEMNEWVFPKTYMGMKIEDILARIDVTMDEFEQAVEQFSA